MSNDAIKSKTNESHEALREAAPAQRGRRREGGREAVSRSEAAVYLQESVSLGTNEENHSSNSSRTASLLQSD